MVCSINSKNNTVYYNPNSRLDNLFFRTPHKQKETYIENFKKIYVSVLSSLYTNTNILMKKIGINSS